MAKVEHEVETFTTSGYAEMTGPVYDYNPVHPIGELGSAIALVRLYSLPLRFSGEHKDANGDDPYLHMLRIIPSTVRYFNSPYTCKKMYYVTHTLARDYPKDRLFTLMGITDPEVKERNKDNRNLITGVTIIYKNKQKCEEINCTEDEFMMAAYHLQMLLANQYSMNPMSSVYGLSVCEHPKMIERMKTCGYDIDENLVKIIN